MNNNLQLMYEILQVALLPILLILCIIFIRKIPKYFSIFKNPLLLIASGLVLIAFHQSLFIPWKSQEMASSINIAVYRLSGGKITISREMLEIMPIPLYLVGIILLLIGIYKLYQTTRIFR